MQFIFANQSIPTIMHG